MAGPPLCPGATLAATVTPRGPALTSRAAGAWGRWVGAEELALRAG